MLEEFENIQELSDSINEKKNIFFIGTSEFGEVNVPTYIPDLAYLYATFGRKGTLIETIENILDDEFKINNIYVVKTTGSHSKALLDVNVIGREIIDSGVILKAKHSSEKFDDIKVSLTEKYISFSMNEENNVSYKYEDYITINNLANKINKDTNNGDNYVYMETYVDDSVKLAGALSTVNSNEFYLHTGSSGLSTSKNKYYISLKNTLELLEGYEIDVLVPLGAYLDDICYEEDVVSHTDKLTIKINNKSTSFYELITDFIHLQFNSGITTIGVLGYNHKSNLSIDEKILILEKNKENVQDRISNSFICISSNNLYNSKLNRVTNGQAELGCLIRNTIPTESITFKNLPKFYSPVELFTNDKLIKLADNHLVAFRYSYYKKKTVVSTSMTTSSCKEKGYHYMQNIITLQFITKILNLLCEKYIGEDINKVIKSKQLENEFKKILSELRVVQYIQDYEVNLERVSTDEIEIHTKVQSIFTLDFLEILNKLKIEDMV